MQNLFRLRIEADEAGAGRRLTFVDDGGPDRESGLALLVEWSDRGWQNRFEPVFEDFLREHRDAGNIVSPGAFLERLVQGLDAVVAAHDAPEDAAVEFAVALSCGRGLYLLHSNGFEPRCSLDDGVPQPLVSSLRVRVKDLSPGTMRHTQMWSASLVERLHLLRVFFEDEDAATVQLAAVDHGSFAAEPGDDSAPEPGGARLMVHKEPATDAALAAPFALDSGWPDLESSTRRDRRTLSYVAVGLVAVLFGTALFGMWRWHRMGSAPARGSGAEALFSEPVDARTRGRAEEARVASEEADPEGERQAPAVRAERGQAAGELSVLWSKRHSDWVTSSPRLVRGRVVYGCRDGHLYAVDPEGEVQWDYDSGAGIGATPATDDGRVFCGNYAGRAFALRDKDGKELWSVELGSRLVASPTVGKRAVFFASQAGEIVALSKKNGEVVWRATLGGKLRATPLAAGKHVYAPGAAGELVCFDQGSGQVRWSYDAGSPVQSSPMLADGRLVFGCKDGTVHAVESDDGTPVWSLRTKGAVQATPAANDGVVYVGSSDKRLYAIRLASGDIAWSFPTQAAILASPTVQDGKVYITAYDRCTYVVEAETGRQMAKLRLKAPIYSSPLVASGRIYCGSNDGTLYCMSDVR